ncbi:MAG: hypothetical protein WA734_13930 [Candidatus Acidiferrales bacterium]
MNPAPSRIRRLFSNPIFLLGLTAFLAAFVVQSGELGSSDTTHRLQTAHSFWTSEPPVFPDEYPEFGIHGRNGRLYAWYGIGQSLLLLPSDIVGTYIAKLPVFDDYDDTDPNVRDIVVSFTTNILVCVLSVLVCYRLLGLLDFSVNERLAGALALLFGTTFLHYTQNMMENNYILLLTLTGLTFQYEWLKTGKTRALLIGSIALGANLLTRLTTGMDWIGVGFFLLLVAWFSNIRGRELWSRFISYAKVVLPVYIFFGLLDRLYQFVRFGSFFNTYMTIVAMEFRQRDPSLPVKYPFETPFHDGFFGALFSPEKSIFTYDPLLILAILICIFGWKRFSPPIRAYLIAFGLLLLAYISFYARYTDWAGDTAWGDRYAASAGQLFAFISVPVLVRYRNSLIRSLWPIGIGLAANSVAVQLASVAFWCPLERYQMEMLDQPTFFVGLRFSNIWNYAVGHIDRWGLSPGLPAADMWDYVHITTLNFLPFVLKRVGVAPHWIVALTMAIWFSALAALFAVLILLYNRAGRRSFTPSTS